MVAVGQSNKKNDWGISLLEFVGVITVWIVTAISFFADDMNYTLLCWNSTSILEILALLIQSYGGGGI